MPKLNLIQRQEKSIERLMSIPPVGRRGAGILQDRMRRGARKEYEKDARRMGYTEDQVTAQWKDIRDMAELRRLADDDE